MAKKNLILLSLLILLFIAAAAYMRFFKNKDKTKEASIAQATSLVAGSQTILDKVSKMEELDPTQVPEELSFFINPNSTDFKLYRVLYDKGLIGYWASYKLVNLSIKDITDNFVKESSARSSREGNWTIGQLTSNQLATNIDFVSNENPPKKKARMLMMQENSKGIKIVIQTMNQND
jgi:hypothetical protein